MFPRTLSSLCRTTVLLIAMPTGLFAQNQPYDVFPDAAPPYYRVRYEATTQPGKLIFPVNYTIWIPKNVTTLRGVVVHQHGCGEGSCRSGLTGAYDLHWQALAKKHECEEHIEALKKQHDEQQTQIEEIEHQLGAADAKWAQLCSQRDVLKSRHRPAEARQQFAGGTPRLIAAFSAGMPNASQPIGCNTCLPCIR